MEFEIRRARKREVAEQRRLLFPVRLVDYEVIKAWEFFDADTVKDLATEIQEYYIPDFTPAVSLDVISLVAGSCRYYRGQIEQRVAHEFATPVTHSEGA